MDTSLIVYAMRCMAGYLLQMAPCAALCLMPFWDRLKLSREKVALLVVAALIVLCIVFSLVGALPLGPFEDSRIFVLNLLFIVFLAPLLALFWWMVDAGRACKTFVFLLVMAYGCLVVMTQASLYGPLGIPDNSDRRMYAPTQLAVLAIVSACTFPLGVLAARRVVKSQVDVDPFDSRWWGMCLVPVAVLLLLVGGYWLPDAYGLPDESHLALFACAAVVSAVVLCVYHMLSSRKFAYVQSARAELASQTRELEREREELASHVKELDRERDGLASRVEELEREKRGAQEQLRRGTSPSDAFASARKVTLKAPGAMVSFFPQEALYLEVLDHTLVVHLAGGREEHIAYGLAKARELLPENLFVQCHRSYLVNRHAVRALHRYEIELVDGALIPVSKQRYREVEAALG